MGNFRNVTMGSGQLKINGLDAGYLKGAVNFKFSYDLLDFKSGTPHVLVGSVAREIAAQLTAPLAEITAENAANLLGGIPASVTTGDLVDKTESFEDKSFVIAPWSKEDGLEMIKLGPVENPPLWVLLSDDDDAPLIMDSALTQTYDEGVDYIVDYATGAVYRNPTGAIESGQTVKVKYKYTPPASKQLKLGSHFDIPDVDVEFIHTNPNLGKKITIRFWKAKVSGNAAMHFEEDKWLISQIVFKALSDDAHPDSPLGYVNFEV